MRRSVSLAWVCQDYINSTNAVLSITAVNTERVSFWRAVLRVKGEKPRYGTRHRSAVESVQKLLSKWSHRIPAAAKERALEVIRGDDVPKECGTQPRSSRCVPSLNQLEGQRPVKKVRKELGPLRKEGLVAPTEKGRVAPTEKGRVGDLHYLIRMPLQAEEDLSQPAPLLLFLHGSGERGKGDGSELHKVLKHGPWQGGGADPFFILAPQCPRGHVWPAFVKEVSQLLDDVCIRHMIDKSRVFISGFSMGAFGTWSLAVTHPHKFAGIVSICGGFIGASVPTSTSRTQMLRMAQMDGADKKRRKALKQCQNIPVWLFHGMKDRIVDPKCGEWLFDALGGTKNERVIKTTYHKTGHDCWSKAYATVDVYTWMLSQTSSTVIGRPRQCSRS
jgi:predicted esterase